MNTNDNTVLLVEDEESHAAFITRVFEENSSAWKIDHVSTLADALKWLKENKNKSFLVISDYRLPDGTGLDLTKDANSPEKVGYPLIIPHRGWLRKTCCQCPQVRSYGLCSKES